MNSSTVDGEKKVAHNYVYHHNDYLFNKMGEKKFSEFKTIHERYRFCWDFTAGIAFYIKFVGIVRKININADDEKMLIVTPFKWITSLVHWEFCGTRRTLIE